MPAKVDLTGQRFTRLVVLGEAAPARSGTTQSLCQCDCGAVVVAANSHLRHGFKKSCGCLRKDTATKHGLWKHPLYWTHQSMIQRCANPSNTKYSEYGGRGIRVCDRWRFGDDGKCGFELFLADMGERPSHTHTLDRSDNDGNYEPSNVRWATKSEQSNNQRERRDRRVIELDGQRMTIQEACALRGLEPSTVYKRFKQGQTVEQAFTVRRKSSKDHQRLASTHL